MSQQPASRRPSPVTAAFLVLAVLALATRTGSASAALPDGFEDHLVIGGLTQPSSFAFLPDGRVLIVEQNTAAVKVLANGSLTTIHTVADVQNSGNEQGLLGITVDPRWPACPYLYLMFDRTPGSVMYIVRLTLAGDLADPASNVLNVVARYDIITDIPDNASNHNAGTLRFGTDSMLYASLGDDANACAAQDSSDFRGVILRMNVCALPDTGTGPANKALITPGNNPFPPDDPEAGLTFAFGLRNPFRFQVDPVTGYLYVGDVGLRNYEEVDEVTGGENLGWPHREGPNVRVQSSCPEPGGSGSQTYDGPIGGYDRSGFLQSSIIGGPRYRPVPGGAHSFPALYDGAVFFAEYYQGFIRVLVNTGGSWGPLAAVPGQPNATDWATGIATIGDFLVGPDGAVYYLRQFPGELRRLAYTGTVTGVPDGMAYVLPRVTVRPNPFRPASGPVIIEAQGQGRGTVEIFAISGKRVRSLFSGQLSPDLSMVWDGRDDEGRPVPAGVYLVHLAGRGGEQARRVVLIR